MDRQLGLSNGTRGLNPVRRRVSNTLGKWLDQGGPLFQPGSRRAIEHVERLWHATPTLGRLAMSYGPRSSGSHVPHEARLNLDAVRELDTIASWFDPAHWRIFENVVRDGHPAGAAAAHMAEGAPAATATAKAVVGTIASAIAARKGWR